MTKPQIFRPSTYNIIVELKNAPNKYMMVHGYTGAIDIANPNVIELLKPGNRVSRVNSLVSIKTFNTLVKRGYLTQKTAAEERQFCQRWANFMHSWRKRFGMRSFMFMVTYDCNFRCPYCYESTISEHGRQWTKKTFTKEMVDRAYEAMTEIEPDEQKRIKSITLYGGEPLLAKNREIVEYIVQKGLERGYKFEAISNGYEIDHYLDLLDSEKIYSIQISVDGPKEIHDRRRYHYQNGGTFDKIFQNIGLALKKGIQISLRANIDATNYQFIESLYDQFENVGYTDNPKFAFSAALVIGDENIRPESQVISNPEHPATLLSKADFNAKMQQTKVPGQHQEMWIYKKLYTAIKHKARIDFSPVYCGVQVGAYILDPFGDIYNCWETVGKKRHILGHYTEGISWEKETENWHQRNIATTPRCSVCKYAFLCGGGCLAKVLKAYNDFTKPYCHSFPEIFHQIANNAYDAYMQDPIYECHSNLNKK